MWQVFYVLLEYVESYCGWEKIVIVPQDKARQSVHPSDKLAQDGARK